MTAEAWDIHWFRIHEDARESGHGQDDARGIADRETELEFGPRPGGEA